MKNWQKVILRNYGVISAEKIAKIIETDLTTVEREALRLGIDSLKIVNPDWVTKGFVTVIRNNWDLLSLNQIAFILDKTVDELNTLLIEYDFLDVKLGVQPALSNVSYSGLTHDEILETEQNSRIIKAYICQEKVKPFDFFTNRVEPVLTSDGEYLVAERFVSSYCADYSNALNDDDLSDYSDEYLTWLKATGTNGIWISETLKNLADFPFDKSYAGDYVRRVKNLRKLTERCNKHGINVYVYLNEPRSLPERFFEKYPELKGQKTSNGYYCLCTSAKKTQEYLYNAIKSLAENVPLLKGIMTITMSENPTHCYSIKWNGESIDTTCPHCKERKPQEICAEINNIISRALKAGNGYTKLIANLWGWSGFMGWTDEMTFDGIDRLDDDVEILCVSEYGKDICRGGVKSQIIDYSISEVGPSEISRKTLSYAKSKGRKIWAKIQVNNSWECSAIPYLPTFSLMTNHVKNLKQLGVDGMMLGWSLGGYPGGVLPLVNSLCSAKNFDEKEWYKSTFGGNAGIVNKVSKIFGSAFSEFPFSIDSLYYGGHTLGCGNLWDLEKINRKSSMVCFTFDDYQSYTKPYGLETYISQYKKLNSLWLEGLNLIKDVHGNAAYEEFKRYAFVAYIHFKSAENLAVFTKYKSNVKDNADILFKCLNSEFSMTCKLLRYIAVDAKIGYEMTNHYFYNQNILLEKLINLENIIDKIMQ